MNLLEDRQTRQNVQKGNFKIKSFILLLLFVIIIMVSVILCGNNFDIMNQNNIHIHKNEHNSIEIQSQENIKRILKGTSHHLMNRLRS